MDKVGPFHDGVWALVKPNGRWPFRHALKRVVGVWCRCSNPETLPLKSHVFLVFSLFFLMLRMLFESGHPYLFKIETSVSLTKGLYFQ